MFEQDTKSYGCADLFYSADVSGEENYEGKILVLKPSTLKESYQTRENQLFYATDGFGCDPTKIGRKVFGFFLSDGERTSFDRAEFFGVIKPELVPEWAKNNLAKILAGETIEQEQNAPESTTQLNM